MPQWNELWQEYDFRWESRTRGAVTRKLLLPPSAAHRYQYAAASRQGMKSITADGIKDRRIDDAVGERMLGVGKTPAASQTVIWQRDERQVKYERPLMLYDHRPGRRPLLVMGLGLKHVEHLKDQADETRHYRQDETEIPAPLPDYDLIMQVLAERARDAERGRISALNRLGGAPIDKIPARRERERRVWAGV